MDKARSDLDLDLIARIRNLEIDLSPDECARAVDCRSPSVRRENGIWVPACGGTEEPFRTRTGRLVLYCWQPSAGRHAYLDCDDDVIISDEHLSAYGLGA
jgi:hypothetical protein